MTQRYFVLCFHSRNRILLFYLYCWARSESVILALFFRWWARRWWSRLVLCHGSNLWWLGSRRMRDVRQSYPSAPAEPRKPFVSPNHAKNVIITWLECWWVSPPLHCDVVLFRKSIQPRTKSIELHLLGTRLQAMSNLCNRRYRWPMWFEIICCIDF